MEPTAGLYDDRPSIHTFSRATLPLYVEVDRYGGIAHEWAHRLATRAGAIDTIAGRTDAALMQRRPPRTTGTTLARSRH
jgi:hypothetical protein